MKFCRMYAGEDGKSHIEELDLAQRPDLTNMHGTKGVFFSITAPGHFMDWHHAPRRQYVITLSGEMEIGLGDGSVHHFGPGDVLWAEDLTGQGHTRKVLDGAPRVAVTVPLAD